MSLPSRWSSKLGRFGELAGDTMTYGLAGAVAQGLGIFLIPLYTVYLRPADYGVLGMLAILNQVSLSLASLGLRTAVYKEYFAARDEAERRLAVTTGLLAAAACASALALLAQPFAGLLARGLTADVANTPLVRLEMATAGLATVNGLAMIVLQSARQVRQVTLLGILKLLVDIALNVWLIVFCHLGLVGACVANFACEALFSAVCFKATVAHRGREWSGERLVRMLRYGLPFVPSRLMGVGMSVLGTFMVGRLLGMHEAGLYGMAARFASPLALAVSAFTNAWSTIKFKARAEYPRPAEFFAVASTYATALFVYLWLGIVLWGPEVLRLFAAPAFHGAAGLIALVSFPFIPQALNQLLGTGVELLADTRRVPLASLGALVVAATLGLLLVPSFGAPGAALATTLSHATLTFGNYWISRRGYEIPFDWRTLGSLVILGILVAGLASGRDTLPVGGRLALSAILTLAFPGLAAGLLWTSRERPRLLTFWRRMTGEAAIWGRPC